MKKLIYMPILFISILGISIWESNHICKTFNYLETELTIIESMLEQDSEHIDSKENIESIENLHKKWQEKTKILKVFVWHTGIKDVEVGLSRIQSYTEENNFTEAKVELQNLLDFSIHYANDFKISWENIF